MPKMVARELIQSIYIPTLSYACELCLVTENMAVLIQEAEIWFLHRNPGLSLKDSVRSSDIQRDLGVELLFLCIKGVG